MAGHVALVRAVKDACIGSGLFLFSIRCWNMYDWNEERKVRKLYDGLLEKGEIYRDLLQKGLVGVVAEERENEIPFQIMNSDLDYAQSLSFK